jgi:predicted nucleotidyltransferase
MHNLEEGENVLLPIKNDLKILLKGNIVSAVVYGSSLSDDYCFLSDIDILMILKNADHGSLKILRKIKEKYKLIGFDIDFNVHSYDEIPDKRKGTFWHNNRSLYMQIELYIYGRQLIGKNLFNNKNINLDDLRLEVVRVISSLTYQARKMLINTNRIWRSFIRSIIAFNR